MIPSSAAYFSMDSRTSVLRSCLSPFIIILLLFISIDGTCRWAFNLVSVVTDTLMAMCKLSPMIEKSSLIN